MTYDLLITGGDSRPDSPSQPINRQTWLNLAVASPALILKTSFPDAPTPRCPTDEVVDHPAFSLLGQYGRPILFWRDGAIIVRQADDYYLPDIFAIVRALGARLLDADGREFR